MEIGSRHFMTIVGLLKSDLVFAHLCSVLTGARAHQLAPDPFEKRCALSALFGDQDGLAAPSLRACLR